MKDKVVIITGASSGIGKALAFEFAKRNANIVIAARDIEKLSKIEEVLKSFNCKVLAVKVDVTNEEDCRTLIEKAVERFGKINVMINNAGISMRALFEEVDLSVLKRLMATNFWGTVYCTKYALPHLLKTRGTLVGVSSIAGYKGLPGRTGYSASKAAMQGFLDVLRIENMKKGLHVMIACPGFTTSNIRLTALSKDGSQQGESPRDEEKMMSAAKVANKIANGVIARKRTIIMTFEGKATVFLNKFFPRILDRLVYNKMAQEQGSPVK
jgi:short-subunit dehydrogenase